MTDEFDRLLLPPDPLARHDDDDDERSSWAPATIGELRMERGGPPSPPPMSVPRTDGEPLLYVGKVNEVHGEPECGKSWFACLGIDAHLREGLPVTIFDFDDSWETWEERLMLLGTPDLDAVTFIGPDEPMSSPEAQRHIAELLAQPQGLVVIDGYGQALALHGLSGNSGEDVNALHRMLSRAFARAGATVLNLDHVSRDRDGRRFATGSQGKLRDVSGVSYLMTAKVTFAPGMLGASVLTVSKDRRGMVRRASNRKGSAGRCVLDARAESLTLRCDPPTADTDTGDDLTQCGRAVLSVLQHDQDRAMSLKDINDAVVTEGIWEAGYRRETLSKALNGELGAYVDSLPVGKEKVWWRID